MKKLFGLLALLLGGIPAFGQSLTRVTGVLTDPNSVAYYPARVQACLTTTGVQPTATGITLTPYPHLSSSLQTNYCAAPVTTDSSGAFSMLLVPNSGVTPSGSQYTFTVQTTGTQPPAGKGSQTFTSAAVTVTGATQDVSTSITSVGPAQLNSGGGGISSTLMTTLGDLIAEDATPTPVRLPGPTTPNGVPQVLTNTPSGGLAAANAWGLPGLLERDVTGATATDLIASTDCSPKAIFYQGSVAVAVTLPTATTLGVPNCVFTLTNNTSGSSTAVIVTPTTWTVAPGGTSLAIAQGQACRFTVDAAVATQWDADCHDAPIVAGSNITITRGQYGPTVASTSSGGGYIAYGTGGGSANAQTVTTTPNITSLVAGQTQVCWLPVANSSGVPTLAVDGLAAKTIVNQTGSGLSANDLSTTTWACAIYDGTNFELFNPASNHALSANGATATLTAGNTLTITALNSGGVNIGDNNSNYLAISGVSGVQQRVPSRAIGTVPTLSGTGACATTSTQTGGSWAGSGKCTGTTGAATLTITFAVSQTNGYVCEVQNETTPANLFQQTSHTATTCVLTAAVAINQNDIFVFKAVGF